MSERPTPETDALASEHRGAVIWPDLARRLERERDAERSLSNQLAGALMVTRWDSYTICKEAIFAWKEARNLQ